APWPPRACGAREGRSRADRCGRRLGRRTIEWRTAEEPGCAPRSGRRLDRLSRTIACGRPHLTPKSPTLYALLLYYQDAPSLQFLERTSSRLADFLDATPCEHTN